ncbi:hypothetical protein PF010_g22968 [Phytophthora fragariae]|uniref:Uncharacterized protein n=1 Tax=Phytophthora fragariae TaxID=53985 RepID=A0A6G0K6V7_9STRA|nr:hypothetical protein PF010_g22968 [Phytophthora fragariae]
MLKASIQYWIDPSGRCTSDADDQLGETVELAVGCRQYWRERLGRTRCGRSDHCSGSHSPDRRPASCQRELVTEGGWRAAEKLEPSDTENRPVPLPTQTGEPRSTLGTDPRCSPEVVDARPRIQEPQEARGRVEKQSEARRHAD